MLASPRLSTSSSRALSMASSQCTCVDQRVVSVIITIDIIIIIISIIIIDISSL
jgi:hypothetical protein